MRYIILTDHPLSALSLMELNQWRKATDLFSLPWEIIPFSALALPELFPETAKTSAGPPFKFQGKTYYPSAATLALVDELKHTLSSEPFIAIVVSPLCLWALTEQSSIDKWRGSILPLLGGTIFPTHPPSRVFREFWLKRVVLRDFERVRAYINNPTTPPAELFITQPDYATAHHFLSEVLANKKEIAVDIETTASHFIGCIGLAISNHSAMCITFIDEAYQSFFTPDEELSLILLLREILTTCPIIMQNGAFDAQYFARDWGVLPRHVDDTMIAHHVCYNSLPKDLGFLSSLYLHHHRYWKDEGKFIDEKKDFKQWWIYNCRDACSTYAIMQELRRQLSSFSLTPQYEEQIRTWHLALRTMVRGVRIDNEKKLAFAMEVMESVANIESELDLYTPIFPQTKTPTPWYNSPTQLASIFYDHLLYPVFYNRKTKQRSTDDECLTKLKKKAPLISPLIERILELRSLRLFHSTFLSAGVGRDGRMRTSYDPAGTETYRFASRKDSFGGGMNLQNIPRNR